LISTDLAYNKSVPIIETVMAEIGQRKEKTVKVMFKKSTPYDTRP